MGEPKAFASPSSGLLARKGAARPAMRPQGFGQVGAGLEDLGWNDMGFEAPKPALAPVRDDQHDAFGEELSEPALRNPLAALTPSAVADRLAGPRPAGRNRRPLRRLHRGIERRGICRRDRRTLRSRGRSRRSTRTTSDEDEARPRRRRCSRPSRTACVGAARAGRRAPAPADGSRSRRSAAPRPRAAPGSKAKAAFTLRLDAERHLKLRLACAVTGRRRSNWSPTRSTNCSARCPNSTSMADRAPRKRANR